jgi:hypothetical protein
MPKPRGTPCFVTKNWNVRSMTSTPAPLLETAADLLNRLMRGGVNDEELAGAVKTLREEGRLTYTEEDAQLREPRVVCSLGLIPGQEADQ